MGPRVDAQKSRLPPWGLLPSLVLHGLLVLSLAFLTLGHPVLAPSPRSIQVDLINTEQFPDQVELPPVLPSPRLATPERPNKPIETAPPAPSDGMTTATELFANRILRDPMNREVADAMPTLDPYERVTQLCNIEGLEQLRLARPGPLPEAIFASAFGETNLHGLTLEAPTGAFRVAKKWYALSFVCTITPNFDSVLDYRFKVGDAIPESEWDSHFLNAEDEEE